MFIPHEIIFVPTQQCNLHCRHCFVPNTPQTLDIEKAEKFIETAVENGIDRIGFSGGEPFLNPAFLERITAAAVDKGMYFDRIMTNAVWYTSDEQLKSVLQALYDAGFDGTICISYDIFHDQNPEKVKLFMETVFSMWKDRRSIEISAVKSISSTDNTATVSMLEQLAVALDASLANSETQSDNEGIFPKELIFSSPLANAFIYYEDENDSIRIHWIDQTGENPEDPQFWQSSEWFAEDFCDGPGQVLYVHADGSIAPCCGYANENAKLKIGSLYDMSLEQVVSNAKAMNIIQTVYEKGLLKEAKKMEKERHNFPGTGKTNNNCQFCAYMLNEKIKQ